MAGELDSGGKMLGTKQQVVGYLPTLQFFKTFDDIRPQQPSIIRFVVNRVADSLEFRASLQLIECPADLRIGQVHPCHDTQHPGVRLREVKQPRTFAWNGSGLHDDGTIETVPLQDGL